MFLYIDPLKQGLKRERNSGKRDWFLGFYT